MATKEKKAETKNGESRDVRVEHATKRLLVKLTPQQMGERSKRLGRLFQERDQMDEDRKAANKLAAANIAEKDAECRRLMAELAQEAAHDEVRCQIVYDYHRNVVLTKRADTGEVVDERAMQAAERQAELELEEADKAKEAGAEGETEKPARKPRARRSKGKGSDEAPEELGAPAE